MIKFCAGISGNRLLLGIGLSEGNIELLKEGRPIVFSGEDLGIRNLTVIVDYGETEQALVDKYSRFITKETDIHPSKKDLH